ncbi:hypothetical protein [Halorussus marinus]|uniref:hypothetical protein n=1 Tax=Halorussus marinus TaxID=2505976 RepID=UPI00106DEB0D|nr:hypothetical protein [Halorussus marinus]
MDRLTDIIDATEETADGVTEVSKVTEDQATSIEQVAAVVDELSETTASLASDSTMIYEASQYQHEVIDDIQAELTNAAELVDETDE